MNVWLINHYANTPDVAPISRHGSLAETLVKQGHQVTVIGANLHHMARSSLKGAKPIRKITRVTVQGGVRYVLLPVSSYKGNDLGRMRSMLQFTWGTLHKASDLAQGRPDVVIGSSNHPFAAWAGQRLARGYKVPFVFEVRDLWPQSLIDMGALSSRHPLAIALYGLEWFLYQRAMLTITLLPYAHEYMEQFGVPRERIFYLPNGVDLTNFPLMGVRSDPRPFTLMYFGTHGRAQGLFTLLEAAAELERETASSPLLWRFIGDGVDKAALMRRASELRLRSVRFEDLVPKGRIPALASEADGFIFHLRDVDVFKYGISPNKLFDFMAAGRPVIFGCNSRNNPVAEAEAGFSVPSEDPNAMAMAVQRLMRLSPDERTEMGLRGRRCVEVHHNLERLGERLEAALNDLIEVGKVS